VSTTYAVIAASSELSSPEEGGRVLWVWQDDGSLRAKEKQKSKIVVRDISIEPCEYKSDFATVSFDDTLVLFYEGIDLLCGNVLSGKEYMFVKSHDELCLSCVCETRALAAKPQRLLLRGRNRKQESVKPRRSRAETREAGTLPFRTISPSETGPPFSHQPEDRVCEQGGLYGFLKERQARRRNYSAEPAGRQTRCCRPS